MGGPIPDPDEGSREWIVKAEVAETFIPDARSSLAPDEKDAFSIEGVLGTDVVPFPLPAGFKNPEVFVKIWRTSAALQPAVEAYSTDIDGMGHTFEPAFDPHGEKAVEELREAHELYRAWEELYSGKDEDKLHVVPDDEALKVEVEDLKREARRQKMTAEYFFKSACRETSFTRMRRNTRQQSEIGGNWYWEVVRKNGKPIRLKHPPFQSMRALKEDRKATKVTSRIQITPIHWVDLDEHSKFRRYVQKTSTGKKTFFKQYGDPRPMCACCGKYYPKAKTDLQAKALAKKDSHKFEPGTEVMHDGALHVPGSPYFLPRWIGAIDFVLGEGAAAEMNLAFFNNPFPAGMLLCAGGKFAAGLKTQLEAFMQQMVGTSKGHHKILTVSAVATDPNLLKEGASKVDLKWVPLQKERPKDALFLKWIELCEEKTGRQFRLHTLLYGGSTKLNKATAWAILKFVEERVYQPLRVEFDELMNRTLLPAIGVTLWKFRTLAPETRDPATMIKLYDVLQAGPTLSVDELRAIAADIMNREFPAFNTDWSKFPWKLLQYAKDEDAKLEPEEHEPPDESDDGSDDAAEDHEEPPETDEGEQE